MLQFMGSQRVRQVLATELQYLSAHQFIPLPGYSNCFFLAYSSFQIWQCLSLYLFFKYFSSLLNLSCFFLIWASNRFLRFWFISTAFKFFLKQMYYILLIQLFLWIAILFLHLQLPRNEQALCIRKPKYWSFNLSISPSNEQSGLISIRIDCCPRDSQGPPQYHNSKASILQH